ncbi:MAG TPA: amino acid permease [Candidatus Obscuribacterales bacterium]
MTAGPDNEAVGVAPGGHAPAGHFIRGLGLIDATAVVVGSMIGSGIFIVSAETARHVGSPFWLLMCWLLAGLLTVAGALCYSELASMFPHAGGQYVFLREAYGRLAGFLYGWTLFMVIQSGTIAAVAVAFAKFTGVFVPWMSNANLLVELGPWHFSSAQLLAIAVIALLTAVNCRGIHTARIIQTTFTVTKVGALAGLILLGLFAFDRFHGAAVNFADFWQARDLSGNPLSGLSLLAVLGLAMVGALFSCDAWNNVTFAGEEIKDPERTLPRSLALGTATVALLYVLTNVVYLLLLPLHGVKDGATVIERGIQFAAEDRVGTAAAQVIFGEAGAGIMAAAIMISTFGCLNGLILAGPRAYYAMARDGLFFKKAGVLHPEVNVPVAGLVIQGVWASLLATSGTYSNLLEYVVFAALFFYVLTVGAVFVLRRTRQDVARPYSVPWYPFLPALYIVFALAIMLGQLCLAPRYTGAGLVIILSGLPAYLFWRAKSRAAGDKQ